MVEKDSKRGIEEGMLKCRERKRGEKDKEGDYSEQGNCGNRIEKCDLGISITA